MGSPAVLERQFESPAVGALNRHGARRLRGELAKLTQR
jgi:hypothetical protein